MRRFLGTDDLGAVTTEGLTSECRRVGLETDKGRRFAIWSLLYMPGSAPDLEVAFSDHADRDAVRTFMVLLDRSNKCDLIARDWGEDRVPKHSY